MEPNLRILAALVVASAASALTGCDDKKKVEPAPVQVALPAPMRQQPGQDGWPVELYFERLNTPLEVLRSQATRGDASGHDLDGPGTIRTHYPHALGPTAHGATGGTEVIWVRNEGSFFLRSDCKGLHIDGFVGPFAGDPREVLKPLQPPDPEAAANNRARALEPEKRSPN